MNRWRVRFFLLFTFLVVEFCSRTDGQRLATRSVDTKEDKPNKPTENDFLYVVRSKSGKACILMNMEIGVTIPQKVGNMTVNIPKNAIVEGTCKPTISELTLSWEVKGKTTKNAIRFTFINDHTKFSVFSIDVEIYDNETPFKASSDIDLHLFAASATSGFHSCNKMKKIKVADGEVAIENVLLVAFNTNNEISSRNEEKCDDEDDTKTFPYVLRDDKNKICTLARMSISLEVAYETKDSKTKTAVMHVPNDARVTGICRDTDHTMELVWSEKAESEPTLALNKTDNLIIFQFLNDGKNVFLNLVLINIFMDKNNFPEGEGGRITTTYLDNNLFLAPAQNGIYSCADNMTLTTMLDTVNITMGDILLVAFNGEKDFASKNVTDCNYNLSEDSFDYVVRDNQTNVPCTLANMKIEIHVPYKTANSDATATLHVPLKDSNVRGFCKSKFSKMELSWTETSNTNLVNKISFYIARNTTTFLVSQIEVDISKDEKNFPSATNKEAVFQGMTDFGQDLFPAHADNGLYNCSSSHKVQADDIEIVISNVIFIAFNTEDNLNSKTVTNCSPSTTEPTTEPTTKPTKPSTESSTESTPEPPAEPPTEPSTNQTTTLSEPDPSVKKFNYRVFNPVTNAACIVANMSISIKVPYKTENSEAKTAKLDVPLAAKTIGDCNSAMMQLTWTPDSKGESKYESENENKVTFNFKRDQTKYFLDSIDVHVYMDDKNFPGAGDKIFEDTAKDLNTFSTPLTNLYQCAPERSIKGKQVEIVVKNVALMVFNEKKNVAWSSVENCVSEDSTESNVGPIVGGVIGGAIIIAVIIFAIVTYRRKRQFR